MLRTQGWGVRISQAVPALSNTMQDHIDIYFKQTPAPLTCTIDGVKVTVIDQVHACVKVPAKSGIRMLSLQLIDAGRAEIVDVRINGASVRHLLYLSWTASNNKKMQPCTAVWESDQTWYLPFGNPVSWWLDITLSKIPQHYFGKDLGATWDIWYPDRIELPDQFPTVVRDFFSTDFAFTVRPRDIDHRLGLPMQELTVDPAEIQPIANRAHELWQRGLLDSVVKQEFAQDQYNSQEDTNWQPGQWQIYKLMTWDPDLHAAKATVPESLFPEFFSWIKQFSHVHHAQINFLKPGSYIAPHRDFGERDQGADAPPAGCNQCYIPLQWEPGSYLKLAGAGILDTSRAWIINNAEFTHSVVNNSQSARSVLIVRADMQYNKHLLKEMT